MAEPRPTIRLDKWLWFARFYKTRGLASRQVAAGRVRVNAARVVKPAFAVGPGDVLTFPQGQAVRVVRVLQAGARRGPAPEARTLYEDLSPVPADVPPNPAYEGKGRPSKKARRDAVPKGGPPLE
ncbi:MAG: RNA-binding S4 domain-containing protein [Tranquillimonas sp.]